MAQPTPPPPTTIHTSHQIALKSASTFLTAYLTRATQDPSLQPDATITEHGPAGRTTNAAPNLALHNLRRVAAGIEGEVLGRDLVLEERRERESVGEGAAGDEGGNGGGQGWEDAKRYEQGDAANGNPGADEDVMEVEIKQEPGSEGLDKEERKRKKKERRLAEKRAKSGAGA